MNDITTQGNTPFNPSLRMSSLEIAELMEKQHAHVLRDIRELIDQEAIGLSSFGESSYINEQNKNQPMYTIDFEASMVLITGYDATRRAAVIKRWMALERGEAVPALTANSALDAMVSQVIQMVIPAVISQATAAVMGQITPMLQGLQKQVTNVQVNFSHVGTIWSFCKYCCKEGSTNTYVSKDELYRAYCEYCATIPYCRPEGKSAFFTKLYRAFLNTSSFTISRFGEKVTVVRGMALLPGYEKIIEDLRHKRQEEDAAELARRREWSRGVTDTEVQ